MGKTSEQTSHQRYTGGKAYENTLNITGHRKIEN